MGNASTTEERLPKPAMPGRSDPDCKPNLSKSQAAIDTGMVVIVMASVWSLRFAGASQVGALTMAAGLVTVGSLLLIRKQSIATLGLAMPKSFSELMIPSLRLMGLFGVVWLLLGLIVTTVIGQPETSSAITEQPQSLWGFLLDITLITWVLIAFGEEVVFRGFILQRLINLLGRSTLARHLAIGLQAMIFGLGHLSQGISGILLTASIGYLFGWFFLTGAKRSLWPLVLVHGIADTVMLTVVYFL